MGDPTRRVVLGRVPTAHEDGGELSTVELDGRLRERLRSMLQTYLEDNRQAWDLDAEGCYHQRVPDGDVRASQARLLVDSWGEHEAAPAHDAARAQHTGD